MLQEDARAQHIKKELLLMKDISFYKIKINNICNYLFVHHYHSTNWRHTV